ncbi:MAG: hypothetical protein ACK4NW_02110 [Roseinatronobacter sp.]
MNAPTQTLTDAQCDAVADAVLRAAGSALRHYTMPKSRDDIRAAVRQSLSDIQET